MMAKTGLVTVALLVGCAAGVVVRQVVFPAQAAANLPVYDYKLVPMRDLIETVKAQNRGLPGRRPRAAAEEAASAASGHAGWRYAGCFKDQIFGWAEASAPCSCSSRRLAVRRRRPRDGPATTRKSRRRSDVAVDVADVSLSSTFAGGPR